MMAVPPPAMPRGSGRLVVWFTGGCCAPVTVRARLFRVDRVGGGAAARQWSGVEPGRGLHDQWIPRRRAVLNAMDFEDRRVDEGAASLQSLAALLLGEGDLIAATGRGLETRRQPQMNNLYQRAAKIGTNFETRSTFRS